VKKRSHLAREIVETVALAILIFLVIRFVIQSYHIEGPSMQPGLHQDEYVLVNKTAYLFHQPNRGDVIVFHAPPDTTKDFIKRVIGLPGDIIQTSKTDVWVNGKQLNEPYIADKENPNGNIWKVPANEYFVLGDNRLVSDDSRDWCYVPKDYIVGKAAIVYWPVNKWETIPTYSPVYAQIPAPPTNTTQGVNFACTPAH
jgi:signal peptidase I